MNCSVKIVDEDYKFRTNIADLPLMFKDPKKPNQEQFDYVQNCFNRAETALYSESFLDSELGYKQYIDIDSFLKFYIVQELSKNVDGNMRGSCYMALKSDGKIYQPFVWDFDIAFGNAKHITWEQGADSAGPDGWFIKTCSPWFDRFFLDPAFVSALKKKWNSLKPQLDKLPDFIQEQAIILWKQLLDVILRMFLLMAQVGQFIERYGQILKIEDLMLLKWSF